MFLHHPAALKAFTAYFTDPQSCPTFPNFIYFCCSHNWWYYPLRLSSKPSR